MFFGDEREFGCPFVKPKQLLPSTISANNPSVVWLKCFQVRQEFLSGWLTKNVSSRSIILVTILLVDLQVVKRA